MNKILYPKIILVLICIKLNTAYSQVACLKDSLIYTLNGIVQEKKYYKYNAFDSLKEVVTTNAAVNQDLETWEYDDTNHPHLPSSYESKNWYGNAWTKDVIVLYQYNSNGQINTELKYKFSYPIPDTSEVTRTTYLYNQQGLNDTILYETRYFSQNTILWRPDYIHIKSFNSQGKIDTLISKMAICNVNNGIYENCNWIFSYGVCFQVYDYNDSTTIKCGYDWDDLDSQLIEYGVSVLRYDNNGNLIEQYDSLYNQSYPDPVKIIYTYDGENNRLTSLFSKKMFNVWQVLDSSAYFYDNYNNLVKTIGYSNSSNAEYMFDYFYTCTDVTHNKEIGKQAEVAIYPNPATSLLTVVSKNNCNIKIVNSIGVTVIDRQLFAGNNVLDIDFIPKGIYFLSSDNGYITKVLKY